MRCACVHDLRAEGTLQRHDCCLMIGRLQQLVGCVECEPTSQRRGNGSTRTERRARSYLAEERHEVALGWRWRIDRACLTRDRLPLRLPEEGRPQHQRLVGGTQALARMLRQLGHVLRAQQTQQPRWLLQHHGSSLAQQYRRRSLWRIVSRLYGLTERVLASRRGHEASEARSEQASKRMTSD